MVKNVLEICLTEAYGLDSISCAFCYLEPKLSECEVVRMQRAALHCYACAVVAMGKWSFNCVCCSVCYFELCFRARGSIIPWCALFSCRFSPSLSCFSKGFSCLFWRHLYFPPSSSLVWWRKVWWISWNTVRVSFERCLWEMGGDKLRVIYPSRKKTVTEIPNIFKN